MALARMANVLSDKIRQQVVRLFRLGGPLRPIEDTTANGGVDHAARFSAVYRWYDPRFSLEPFLCCFPIGDYPATADSRPSGLQGQVAVVVVRQEQLAASRVRSRPD
jgi:hypothetical protein